MDALILEIEDLGFSHGKTIVLDQLSFNVSSGTIVGIVGASGSGKTTLIRLITGVLQPDTGTIKLFGERPSSKLWEKIGYMPQTQALYPDLTVEENLSFFSRMFGLSNRAHRNDRIAETIWQVSLWEKRKAVVSKLSGGERQRVSLGVALIHRPPILLLDEPTVGLDPQLRANLWNHFRHLVSGGTTLILSSHVMEDAGRCDRVGFLQFGRMIADGTPSQLMAANGKTGSTLDDAFLYFMDRETLE